MSDFHDPAGIYLENEVHTASPQRLRLMLIQAALRRTQQVVTLWQAGDISGGNAALTHAQEIIMELQASVRSEESDLAAQVAALYAVMYFSLVEAQIDTDVNRVQGVVRGLQEENETWMQYCLQGDSTAATLSSVHDAEEPPNSHFSHGSYAGSESSSMPHPHFNYDLSPTEGLSFEA